MHNPMRQLHGAGRRRAVTATALPALLLACCLSLLGSPRPCSAYPELFVDNGFASSCTDHPSKPLGEHGAPVPDTTTTFTLTAPKSTDASKTLCPGVTYDLVVDYGLVKRRTLLTASVGKLGSPGGLQANSACPNRAASAQGATNTFKNTLTIPCDTKAPSVQLKVTSAGKAVDTFHTVATTLPLSPVGQCPGSTCPGAPPAAAAPTSKATGGSAAADAAAAPADTPAAAPKGGAAAAAGAKAALAAGGAGACGGTSLYKYACSTPLGQGATLHYTLSHDPAPPANECTAAASSPAAAAAASSSSDGSTQQHYLHMLLESPLAGYSGLSFPQNRGVMYPADAVIGYTDPGTGKPVVSAYHLTNYSPQPSATNANGLGWATSMGVAKPQAAAAASGSGGGAQRLLCFSRAVDAPGAAVSKQLDPKALKLNWVAESSTAFSQPHSLTGDLLLNAADGSASSSSAAGAASGKAAKQVAHGALMLLAFVVFMPAGALLARHKWLFGNKASGGIESGWFHLHRVLQVLAVVLALAGFILALVCFTVPWSNLGLSGTPSPLYNPHRVLGVIAIALSLLQVLLGLARPRLGHGLRRVWRLGHQSAGWLTLAVGLAAVLLGCVLMHDLAGVAYVNWLLPVLLLAGLLVLAGIAAEFTKAKLQHAGKYEPHSHSFIHSAEEAAAAKDLQQHHKRHRVSNTSTQLAETNGISNGSASASASTDNLVRGNSHSHVV